MKQKKRALSGNVLRYFLAVMACLFFALPASAHPPSDLVVGYDTEQGILTVTVTHSVGDPSGHYINEVTVRTQGRVLKTSTYTSQPDRSSFSYTYEVEGKSGNELTVTAGCSRFGSRSASITIP